ncbi:Type II/IV secretion system ATP hydrolase TadA/VirB11/CpaF, TadA subfamily [Thermogutta terrifontis]|jgi:pilus assembly protein CpaF|uniref:Type II/IV secretion system ATP hydrolase TadA/VirB11/CpaF, TadA subfamily n=2 Tax=Thermogutta TaxID=1676125 RepID=A0A286RCD0_9BACT|nr:CpaF family protein [Thermogutta terrifontis]ASV73619.1 Type II/IV secretion system ATP hydrolase TadA/VirB11/CpaF, TadA subfamily [Thermogutta terrifontis]
MMNLFYRQSDTPGNGRGQVSATSDPREKWEAEFQKLKTRLHREVIESLDLSRLAKMDETQLRRHLRNLTEAVLRSRPELLGNIDEERLVDELMAESFGLGPLEPYMQDPDVTDILVNGPYEVYVERCGRLQATNTVFADEEHLLQIIQRIVSRVGRRIDEQNPMVDARLPDGSRVNAVIPPLSLRGPVLSIRRFGHERLKMDDLLRLGSICPEMVTLLQAAVEGRINILISGGAGSGKTTLLNNLSAFIPEDERLVTIEDSAELRLQRKHVVSLETRIANAEGRGEVTPRDLVRNALRMRPDRIILGEVRGAEALDMLQAMNTGHEGSLTTIHANDTRDALSRLEVMVGMAGFELPVPIVRQYIASAITLVVHLARLKGGVRKVMRISEIVGFTNGDYELQELFGFRQEGVDEEGVAKGHFYATGNVPRFLTRLEEQGIFLPESLFTKRLIETTSNRS